MRRELRLLRIHHGDVAAEPPQAVDQRVDQGIGDPERADADRRDTAEDQIIGSIRQVAAADRDDHRGDQGQSSHGQGHAQRPAGAVTAAAKLSHRRPVGRRAS